MSSSYDTFTTKLEGARKSLLVSASKYAATPNALAALPLGVEAACLPDGASEPERLAFAAWLWTGFTQAPVNQSDKRIAALVVSYYVALSPTYKALFEAAGVVFKTPLTGFTGGPTSHLAVLRTWFVDGITVTPIPAWKDVAALTGSMTEIAVADALNALEGISLFGAGPASIFTVTHGPLSYAHGQIVLGSVAYGLLGILTFMAGKNITTTNVTAVTVRRPAALISKFAYTTEQAQVLTGSARMTDATAIAVSKMWRAFPGLRFVVVTDAIGFKGGIKNERMDAAATSALLLEWTGMAHIKIIGTFLDAHPRSRMNPRLAADIAEYIASAKGLAAIPEVDRGFQKALHSDAFKLFRQRDMAKLFAVALLEAEQIDPTLARFGKPASAAAEHALYLAWRAQREQADADERDLAITAGRPVPMIDAADNY